uniref:Phosphate regulon sensor protein PhoR N-terminal domain-containing protein n=1 Tax=Yersinia enterocolitica W22703 TaxID=913028 RepID=F4N3G8_YEREN|nr:hypothetical protein YEW_AY04940 [Yersinia enterocolitica W22703]
MLERLSWKTLALELALFCLPALLLGAFIGYLPWLLLVSVIAALVWNFYNQLKLSHWLWLDRSMTPPSGRWSWGAFILRLVPDATAKSPPAS